MDVAVLGEAGGMEEVAVSPDGEHLVFAAKVLAGSEAAQVRVLATDGINTGRANSAPFIVGDKPPLAWIASSVASS